MNLVVLTGRLTRDPEVCWTTGSTPTSIAKFGLAVDRKYKSAETVQADFFNVTAFGKLAEHLEKYWWKGMKALCVGRLENSSWTDKAGNKRTDTQIILESIEFCEKKEQDMHPKPAEQPADQEGFQQLPEGDGDFGIPFTF